MGAFELLVEAYRPALKAVLANLVRLLETQNVPYVIAGANALSLYVRPRMTIDVDVLVDQARKADSNSLLATECEAVEIGDYHSKFKQVDVEIDVRFANAKAEHFALTNAQSAIILGTRLKAASPEALLWLYLVSHRTQNFVDAITLLRSNPSLDVDLIRRQLEQHQPDLLPKVENILHRARQPVPSYDESRARRKK